MPQGTVTQNPDDYKISDINTSDESNILPKGKREFNSREIAAYISNEETFSRLLKNLVRTENIKEAQKKTFKSWFFIIVMFLFAGLFLAPIVLIILFKSLITDYTIMAAIVASLIELISAIIILPNIIAEYLFNKDEDDNTVKLIELMKSYQQDKGNHLHE